MKNDNATIKPIETKALNGGTQAVYRFDNGYGASVVQGPYTYGGPAGLWELGVIAWDGDDCALTYETPIAYDVLGFLGEGDVAETLQRIKALPARGSEAGR